MFIVYHSKFSAEVMNHGSILSTEVSVRDVRNLSDRNVRDSTCQIVIFCLQQVSKISQT